MPARRSASVAQLDVGLSYNAEFTVQRGTRHGNDGITQTRAHNLLRFSVTDELLLREI